VATTINTLNHSKNQIAHCELDFGMLVDKNKSMSLLFAFAKDQVGHG
jgi:hypothetical protein